MSGAFERAIHPLVEADLIQVEGHSQERGRYRFTHALVHEVVYQNLLLARRTELHERVGRALERAAGPRPERLSDLEALGHHWSLSTDRPRGARYLVAAGDWARAVYANDDAIRHYQRAIQTLAGSAGVETNARAARERLADLLGLTGRRTEALAHYEPLVTTMQANVDNYRQVNSLPDFRLFTVFFVVPGVLLILLAGYGLFGSTLRGRIVFHHHTRPTLA